MEPCDQLWEMGMMVETVNIDDRSDLLNNMGSNEKPDRSKPIGFSLYNLDP
jgi:hypothetical protein